MTPDLLGRIEQYADSKGLLLGKPLGAGVHGSVLAAERQTTGGRSAVKVFERERPYQMERDVYLRLREHSITVIGRCSVPELIEFDDELWVVEMSVVSRPFVLDFAGAYLDIPPEFSDEVMDDWRAEKREQFGDDWPEVQKVLRELEGYGIFMIDVNPGNVSFGN